MTIGLTRRVRGFSLILCEYAQSFSCVQLSVTPWTVARQAPVSMQFSRQEYGSGLPFPQPGNLPDMGTEPASPSSPVLADRFFTTEPFGKPPHTVEFHLKQCFGNLVEDIWRKGYLETDFLKLIYFIIIIFFL